ncbi:cathepsin B [Exaiptasia diaphana]|uniref:Peptidase C1A papain C-terminal domain-containing protein n=1 Tax=Exaiptasia diaphana TaxID=2652724 RepID=A0A913Y5Z0_EXADI|nr:cathepsin B [Exaiptasia diaphana]KXJ22227.1 Cathepsin B-like cysteine proteinase [Exaiptasia diaphana]
MSPILLLVVTAALGSCSSAKELVVSEELVTKVNILNVGWQAKIYPRFQKMTFEQAEMMLGSNGGWPRDNPPPVHRVQPADNIPTNFDAREQWPGSIHPIRNQGACGSCWAFGASETLSDRFAIASQNKINVVLSAQQLVDCNTKNTGCKGGWPIQAWNYMRDVGLLTEQCYGPYYAKQYQCRINANTTQCPYEPGYPARFYKAKNAYSLPAKNVEAVQTEIMTYGPVEADFTVYQDFFAYRSGVYMHATGKAVGGHAIKIIGWGTEGNEDYWLCANSWGGNWGMNGFFKIRRGSDECGIEDGITAGQALV